MLWQCCRFCGRLGRPGHLHRKLSLQKVSATGGAQSGTGSHMDVYMSTLTLQIVSATGGAQSDWCLAMPPTQMCGFLLLPMQHTGRPEASANAEPEQCAGPATCSPSLHMMRAHLWRLLGYARCVNGPSRAQNGVRQYCMVCCRALACMACITMSARKSLHCFAESNLQMHWLQALLTMCGTDASVISLQSNLSKPQPLSCRV